MWVPLMLVYVRCTSIKKNDSTDTEERTRTTGRVATSLAQPDVTFRVFRLDNTTEDKHRRIRIYGAR